MEREQIPGEERTTAEHRGEEAGTALGDRERIRKKRGRKRTVIELTTRKREREDERERKKERQFTKGTTITN